MGSSVANDNDIFGKPQAIRTDCDAICSCLNDECFRVIRFEPYLPICRDGNDWELFGRASSEGTEARFNYQCNGLHKVSVPGAAGNNLAALFLGWQIFRTKLLDLFPELLHTLGSCEYGGGLNRDTICKLGLDA